MLLFFCRSTGQHQSDKLRKIGTSITWNMARKEYVSSTTISSHDIFLPYMFALKIMMIHLLHFLSIWISVPGVNEFAKLNSIASREEVPSWTHGLSQEDINSMHRKNKSIHGFHFKLIRKFIIANWFRIIRKKNSIIVSRSIWDILTEKLVCLRLTVVAYFVQNPMYDVISVKVSQIMRLTT